jgi:hypothetical protein
VGMADYRSRGFEFRPQRFLNLHATYLQLWALWIPEKGSRGGILPGVLNLHATYLQLWASWIPGKGSWGRGYFREESSELAPGGGILRGGILTIENNSGEESQEGHTIESQISPSQTCYSNQTSLAANGR